ncbi:hypothetical protein BDW71DRAFT_77050 [Aspergillus fruticulosus]
MSSVWNHASNCSMVVSLRAAQSSSRSFRKKCSYSTYFRPIYATCLDPFVNAVYPSNSTQHLYGIGASGDPSSCEFWCSSRLKSRLNQPFPHLIKVPEPWGPIEGGGRADHSTHSSPSRFPQPSCASRGDGSPDAKLGASKWSLQSHPSPSDDLIDRIQDKVLYHEVENWTISGKSREPLIAPLTSAQRSISRRKYKRTLQGITADFIQHVEPVLRNWKDPSKLDRKVRGILRFSDFDYLESRQYDITDVVTWAWVLMSNTTYDATLRIFLLETEGPGKETVPHRNIPVFIPLLLLRQELDLKTFRLLLVYSLHHIIMASIDPDTCAKFVVRLFSHARRLWPEALLPIAQAFRFYLRNYRRYRFKFVMAKLDRFIQLLALPPGPRPYVSASVRQQAQFELLKAMAEMHLASSVTRRGYQALAAVQLAHKKTAAEREFAKLKTPSWPPWKEERSGIDSTKGAEGTKSRAMRVISQMREAGHPRSLWEDVAGILAGWDTDNSPTIQTRAVVRRPKHLLGPSRQENHPAIWEARIRSTRTVREAWAAFTAYESRARQPHAAVYYAMGEKLVFVRKERIKRHMAKDIQTSLALPGDGPEVFPEPASARDWIYTSTDPPRLNHFLRRMISQGIRPSGRFLALILQHAPTFHDALHYLSCSDLSNQQLMALLSVDEEILDNDGEYKKVLNELPEYLFSAFIRLLCRCSAVTKRYLPQAGDTQLAQCFPILTSNWAKSQSQSPTLFAYAAQSRDTREPLNSKLLTHAIRLVRKRDSRNPQGWVQLLAGLCSNRIVSHNSNNCRRHTEMLLVWHEVLEVTNWMAERNIDMGSEGFQILCQSFYRAVAAGVKDETLTKQGWGIVAEAAQRRKVQPKVDPSGFEDFVNSGLTTLKRQFDRLVLVEPKTYILFDSFRESLEKQTGSKVTVPAMHDVPSPAVLHAFVRALGLAEDSDGLLNLLRWMSQHALTLKKRSDEHTNGDMLMRRTIVAVRTFLEGYWGRRRPAPVTYEPDFADHPAPSDYDVRKFSDPALQEAYDIVTTTEVWGSWPRDEEVWEYLEHAQE